MPVNLRTKADAKNRSARTLVQNVLGAALSVGLVAAAGAVTTTVTPGEAIDWPTLGAAVGTTVLGALAAWVQRRLEGDKPEPGQPGNGGDDGGSGGGLFD